MMSRRLEDIPLSSEGIRRKVMSTLQQVEKETAVFMDRYLRNHAGNYSQWASYVRNASERASKNADDMEDFKDFEPVLNRLKGDTEVTGYSEYNQMRRVIERGKMFEYITFSLKNELETAYSKFLRVYCISFAPEAKEEGLRTVEDFQSKIETWDKKIQDKLDHLNTILDEADAVRKPLLNYLENYARAIELMTEVCTAMRECCEPMKRWVNADAMYARKIQEEINSHNRRKMDLRDAIKDLEDYRDELGLRLKKRAHASMKVERLLTEARDEKRYFKRRENTISNNAERISADMARKEKDLEEVKARIMNRQSNNPAAFNYMTSMQEALRDEIRVLGTKVDTFLAQMAGLRRDQERAQKDIDRHQTELDFHRLQHESALEKVEKADEDVNLVKNDVKNLDVKISDLKRIRELKLHSDTVKKIFHYGYRPGEMAQFKDELEEAFKLTAEDVGKDWVWLYQKLPFLPPRDYRSRSHDIEVIDLSNRRLDGGFKILTLKSLEKWRRLSNEATVMNLVSTLRKIKKRETARRVQLALQART